MKNNFIVFIHNYSELDMILPFIDYVLTKHNDRVTLYTDSGNMQDAAYYHLEYLKTYHKIKPKYFFEEQLFVKYRHILLLHDKIKQFQIQERKIKKIRYIGYMISIISLIMTRVAEYALEKPIKEYVDTLNISDRIMMYCSGEVKFPCRAIVNYAEKRDIKTIGYFQGFYIYSNLQYTNKAKTSNGKKHIKAKIKEFINRRKRVYCTYYLAARTMKATFFSSNIASDFKEVDRIFETVTPRFTKGWIKTFRKFLNKKEQFDYGDKKKINVVLFLSRVKQNVAERELVEMFNLLSGINNINFVYKSHPRLNYVIDKGYDASNLDSFQLSAWADVCILFGSSIAIHLLLENIPIIVPSFVHTNSTILEKHKICITVNNIGELETLLSNSSKDEIRKLIDNTKVERFLNKHLDSHKDYEQIMQEYYEAVVDNKHFE